MGSGSLLTKSKDGSAVQTFTTNALNQVSSYSDGTLTTNYLYGAQGERIEKSGGATLTSVWDGGMTAMDLPKLSDATSFRGYLNGAGNNGTVRNGVWTPRIPDRAGSTAGTPMGTTFSALTNYDGYGNQKAGPSLTPTSNPYGYDGYYTDAESGLCYLNARYYDPTTQRFTQQDPICDGDNWYGYCGGNPIMYSDPTGLSSSPSYPGGGVYGNTRPPLYTRALRNGSKGGDVQIVQTKLNLRGCTDENEHILKENGIFDKHTTTAVKEFQWAAKLATDGVVGPRTWKSLFGSDVDVGHLLYPDSARKAYGYTSPVKNVQSAAHKVGVKTKTSSASNQAAAQQKLKADKKALNNAKLKQAALGAGMGVGAIAMVACLVVPAAGEAADVGIGAAESTGAAAFAELGFTIEALEQAVGEDGAAISANEIAMYMEEYASDYTQNPNSPTGTVMLGKLGTYDVIGKTEGYTYFSMPQNLWNSLATKYNMWDINQAFLQQQMNLGKSFLLTNDPDGATGLFGEEVGFLRQNGYDFLPNGAYWSAIMK